MADVVALLPSPRRPGQSLLKAMLGAKTCIRSCAPSRALLRPCRVGPDAVDDAVLAVYQDHCGHGRSAAPPAKRSAASPRPGPAVATVPDRPRNTFRHPSRIAPVIAAVRRAAAVPPGGHRTVPRAPSGANRKGLFRTMGPAIRCVPAPWRRAWSASVWPSPASSTPRLPVERRPAAVLLERDHAGAAQLDHARRRGRIGVQPASWVRPCCPCPPSRQAPSEQLAEVLEDLRRSARRSSVT